MAVVRQPRPGALRVPVMVDAREFYELSEALTNKEFRRGMRKGVAAGLRYIRRGVQAALRVSVRPHEKGARRWTRSGYITPGPLIKDVKMVVWKGDDPGGSVSLYDNRKKGGRAYVLRFLNNGTGQRATRAGYNRGAVAPRRFFEAGVSLTKQRAAASLEAFCRSEVKKIAERKVRR